MSSNVSSTSPFTFPIDYANKKRKIDMNSLLPPAWEFPEEEWFSKVHLKTTGNVIVDFCDLLLRKEKLLR